MYLVDTDVIGELRKRDKANRGVVAFFTDASARNLPLYLSAITIGELRRGVESIRYRGESRQAQGLESWLNALVARYSEHILPFDADMTQVCGRLRVPCAEDPLDKQIAATALVYDLILLTRNLRHFRPTGVKLLDPFE